MLPYSRSSLVACVVGDEHLRHSGLMKVVITVLSRWEPTARYCRYRMWRERERGASAHAYVFSPSAYTRFSTALPPFPRPSTAAAARCVFETKSGMRDTQTTSIQGRKIVSCRKSTNCSDNTPAGMCFALLRRTLLPTNTARVFSAFNRMDSSVPH